MFLQTGAGVDDPDADQRGPGGTVTTKLDYQGLYQKPYWFLAQVPKAKDA